MKKKTPPFISGSVHPWFSKVPQQTYRWKNQKKMRMLERSVESSAHHSPSYSAPPLKGWRLSLKLGKKIRINTFIYVYIYIINHLDICVYNSFSLSIYIYFFIYICLDMQAQTWAHFRGVNTLIWLLMFPEQQSSCTVGSQIFLAQSI